MAPRAETEIDRILALLNNGLQHSWEEGFDLQDETSCWLCDDEEVAADGVGLCENCRSELEATDAHASEAVVLLVRSMNDFVQEVASHHDGFPETLTLPVIGAQRGEVARFDAEAWTLGSSRLVNEIAVDAHALDGGDDGAETLATALLEECAKAYAWVSERRAPSRQGRYLANSYWGPLYAEFGIETTTRGGEGVIAVGLGDLARQRYANVLAELKSALVLVRSERSPAAPRDTSLTPTRRNARTTVSRTTTITLECGCRSLRVSRSDWAVLPDTLGCLSCARPFREHEVPELPLRAS